MARAPVRFDPRLLRVRSTARLRRDATAILQAALAAVEPYVATRRALRLHQGRLTVAGRAYRLRPGARVIAIGAGKAGAPMAQAVEDVLGDRLAGGTIVVKTGYTAPLRRIVLREAGHPVPDAAGEAGARELLGAAAGLRSSDLVLCLISGGGSALLPAPQPGVTLDDLVRTTSLLLHSGATIGEINTVRKHLSRVAGGRLAAAAAPARVVTLVVSDIVGNPLEAIASGPTVPDPTTYADALRILDARGLAARVPAAALDALRRGAAGALPETPKPGDPVFRRGHVTVVADNRTAARAAAREARRLGYHALLLSTYMEGEAREVGRVLAGVARQLAGGGETTVTVTGTGRGGRNQEVALGAAAGLRGVPGALVASFASDETDGTTDAAVAVADGTTLARAEALGLLAAQHLRDNDAYPFFDALGDLIRTGPTNTNVTDLMLILCR